MSKILLSHDSGKIDATIALGGSKSISNRALLIRALCYENFDIHHLSDSDDTNTLQHLLSNTTEVYDAGHAGTTFRFLTAYLAFKEGRQVLTGSERMKQRPIGPLVEALNHIGAHIEYAEVEGYPPLILHSPHTVLKEKVSIAAGISSQFISALLMVAPVLPNGLVISLIGETVSQPYLNMTLAMMQNFGIQYRIDGQDIIIPPQSYKAKDFVVESDWSAASYYYAMVALSSKADISLTSLHKDSLQGDAAIATIAKKFGVETEYGQNQIHLSKAEMVDPIKMFEYDFTQQPDIAQTVFALCAGLEVQGLFSGLQTLYIKETDRLKAMATELKKTGTILARLPNTFSKRSEKEYYLLEGSYLPDGIPTFDTYHDHRMAMALAPLALKGKIEINDPGVVSKSYPGFWEDLRKCNFGLEIQ